MFKNNILHEMLEKGELGIPNLQLPLRDESVYITYITAYILVVTMHLYYITI